jgi:DNA-binding NarL/FixJ family response regulator
MLDDELKLAEAEGVPHEAEGDRQLASLSRREREVVGLAARGLTNTEIATRLEVTVHAVKFHLASVYRKLGVGNRTEAAVTYLRHTNP